LNIQKYKGGIQSDEPMVNVPIYSVLAVKLVLKNYIIIPVFMKIQESANLDGI
jgi:hypothetical protein